ncbi:MAG: bifunctional acetate--CoA ligase family protein/GNAT family N-acetyltransferase [Bacteroidota bacterium]
MKNQLNKILKPQNIAVIGASDKTDSQGFIVMEHLLKANFKGQIFPVNIKHKNVHNLQAYRNINDIEESIEVALFCLKPEKILTTVDDCGRKGVNGLVLLGGGFRALDKEGVELLNQAKEKAKLYGLRIIGPGSLGFLNPKLGINASLSPKIGHKGNIAIISQSGAMLNSILDWAVDQNVGFSYVVSIGAAIDVGIADLIDFFGADAQTSSILIYMEHLKDARRFLSAARAFSRNKPIIVLKAGKSQEGQKAAHSHTGVLAGDDDIYNAAFERVGIIRVETIAQLFNCAQALSMQPRPLGKRMAIVTNAGGPGILATDYLIDHGGSLAILSDITLNKLNEKLPKIWSKGNPVDMLSTSTAEDYELAIELCLKDPNVDGVLAILTPQRYTDPFEVAEKIASLSRISQKPLLASWMGEEDVTKARERLEEAGIPNYRFPESAVDVFTRMYRYNEDLKSLYEMVPATPQSFKPDKDKAREIIYNVLEQDRNVLYENEAKELLKCYDLPVVQSFITRDLHKAWDFAEQIGYPVVAKVVSQDIGHKSEVGGVVLNIQNKEDLRKAFSDIITNVNLERPDARIEGILVEKMVFKDYELLFGAKKDDVFGPVLIFGRGGVAVEVFKDTKLGLPPLNMSLAKRIIKQTNIYNLLKGYKKVAGINLDELEFMLCKFAYLVMDFPEIKEIDINPFVADAMGGLVLDAHIFLDSNLPIAKTKTYGHLAISPYPERKYSKNILSKKGLNVLLRPIKPEDEPLMEKMLEDSSSRSLYLRFFGQIPKVTHTWLTRFTHIDYDRELAIVAEIETEENGKEIMGVVRIIEDAWGETAEYAILIADKWQGQGLGSALTDYIIEIARDRNINKIVATVLANNTGMIRLFKNRNFSIDKSDHQYYEVELDLNVPFNLIG